MFVEVEKRDGSRALVNMDNVFSVEPAKDEYNNDVLVFKGNDGTRAMYTKVEKLDFFKRMVMCHKKE